MKAISLGVLAAVTLAIPVALTATTAQAGYCSYKSKDWMQRGIVSCTPSFAPIGSPGTRWKVGKTLMCWNTYGAGGKEYQGYWGPCR